MEYILNSLKGNMTTYNKKTTKGQKKQPNLKQKNILYTVEL